MSGQLLSTASSPVYIEVMQGVYHLLLMINNSLIISVHHFEYIKSDSYNTNLNLTLTLNIDVTTNYGWINSST